MQFQEWENFKVSKVGAKKKWKERLSSSTRSTEIGGGLKESNNQITINVQTFGLFDGLTSERINILDKETEVNLTTGCGGWFKK